MQRRMMIVLVALVAGLIAAVVGTATPAGAQGTAQVRIIHGSPDAPAVDVYVDSRPAVTGLAFPNASPYLPLAAGPHDLQVFVAGANPTSDRPVIAMRGVAIPAGAMLSLVASGRLAQLTPLVINDATTAPASGKAKIRFVHNAPDAPAVDVAVVGGPVLFAGTTFGNAYPYQEVDARAYDLEVRAAGTTNVVLRVPNIVVQSGQVISIYAQGLVMGTGIQSLRAVPYVDTVAATGGGVAITTPTRPAPTVAGGGSVATAPRIVGTVTATPTTRPATVGAATVTGGTMIPQTGHPDAAGKSLLPVFPLLGAAALVGAGVLLRRRAA